MTPQQLAAALRTLSPDQLSQIDHATLYNARQYVPQSDQNLISPYEHEAFAREAVTENPLMALPIAAGTFAWPIYKSIFGARSSPSLTEVGTGLIGVGQGLRNRFSALLGGDDQSRQPNAMASLLSK